MPERPRLHKSVFKLLKKYTVTEECSAVMNDKLKKALGFLTENTNSVFLVYFHSFQKEIPKQK